MSSGAGEEVNSVIFLIHRLLLLLVVLLKLTPFFVLQFFSHLNLMLFCVAKGAVGNTRMWYVWVGCKQSTVSDSIFHSHAMAKPCVRVYESCGQTDSIVEGCYTRMIKFICFCLKAFLTMSPFLFNANTNTQIQIRYCSRSSLVVRWINLTSWNCVPTQHTHCWCTPFAHFSMRALARVCVWPTYSANISLDTCVETMALSTLQYWCAFYVTFERLTNVSCSNKTVGDGAVEPWTREGCQHPLSMNVSSILSLFLANSNIYIYSNIDIDDTHSSHGFVSKRPHVFWEYVYKMLNIGMEPAHTWFLFCN